MSTAIIPVAPSLFDLEQDLAALLDTEVFVSPDQEAEFRQELGAALEASIEKRDRVGQFIHHCVMQQDNCDAEVQRLQERKRSFAAAEQRIRRYVQVVIESLGTDAKGKPKKLEGKTVTFSLRAKPSAVEIVDEITVPAEYKSISVTLPLETWELICDEFRADDEDGDPMWTEMQRATAKAMRSISKQAIKAAIDRGADVPGADLSIGGYSLVVK